MQSTLIATPEARYGRLLEPAMAFPLDDMMAIEPRALERLRAGYGPMMPEEQKPRGFELVGSVGVVRIDGPLLQRAGWCWDGYDAIAARFASAIGDSRVGAVILLISSPGGYIAGLFECIRAMTAMKDAAKKPVYVAADECAFSAAYGLASVADEIYVPQTGGLGSVGVIGRLVDWAKALDIAGINVKIIASGARKADGDPDAPLTDEAIKNAQARVDDLGRLFTKSVAAARGIKGQGGAASLFDAACFYGQGAVDAGLANGVKSFAEVVKIAEAAGRKTIKSSGARGAAGQENRRMNPIAIAMGLAADASETDVVARATQLYGMEQDLLRRTGKAKSADALTAIEQSAGAVRSFLTLTGETTTDGAEGVIKAWKEGALKAEKIEGERLIERINGAVAKATEEGRVTKAELEGEHGLLAQVTKNPTWGIAYLGSKPRVVPGFDAKKEPTEKSEQGAKEAAAAQTSKKYEEMGNNERAELNARDPKAFKAARLDWINRGRPEAHTAA